MIEPMPADHAQERLAAVWNWAVDEANLSLEHNAAWVLAARHVKQLIQASPLIRAPAVEPPDDGDGDEREQAAGQAQHGGLPG